MLRWLSAVALVLVAGCGGEPKDPNRVYVTGRVTSAGTPLQVEGYDVRIGAVRVALHAIKNGKTEESPADETAADEEGNFKFRLGVPPGEYRIVVEQWDPHPSVEKLRGTFNQYRSPIVRTISQEKSVLEIDIAEEVADAKK
ncbi:carboxypeptidase-like regulatory domain-containing protein [Pirellulales bacterium]|nr:carboxypeptidase-like regulatory domain-containing protein [Pirellulales bacterium]